MPAKIVTLTSDFGLKDPYVAEMKAVILTLCPDAIIVDITHEIEKFNVRAGAFMLSSAAPYFPEGTVHVAVVDPGVGTKRRAIVVQTRHGFFVGPDNGLLILAAEKQSITGIREITNSKLMLANISSTFHGRDVFAPAAAHLLNGVPHCDFGPEVTNAVKPEFAKITRGEGFLIGEVLFVDGFGNVITNVSRLEMAQLHLGDWITVELPSGDLKMRFCKTYADAKSEETISLIGSHGYVELAINRGSAAERFQTKGGDKVKFTFLNHR